MPELPEVETMVRGIRPHVEGRQIAGIRRCPCRFRPIQITPSIREMEKRAIGQTVSRVKRLAKRVVLELDNGDWFAIEPRMSGLMLLGEPPDRGHLRFEWHLAGSSEFDCLMFWDRRGLGTVRLYSREDLTREAHLQKLGPDALDVTSVQLAERCARTQRAIKVALLDQTFLAGIGNLYASEILHRAHVHPSRNADGLNVQELRALKRAIQQVLSDAIRHEGSTLGDGTYRNALNQNGRYQNRHRVYGRGDDVCPTCGNAIIVRIVQAQRSTFFCPACQV